MNTYEHTTKVSGNRLWFAYQGAHGRELHALRETMLSLLDGLLLLADIMMNEIQVAVLTVAPQGRGGERGIKIVHACDKFVYGDFVLSHYRFRFTCAVPAISPSEVRRRILAANKSRRFITVSELEAALHRAKLKNTKEIGKGVSVPISHRANPRDNARTTRQRTKTNRRKNKVRFFPN